MTICNNVNDSGEELFCVKNISICQIHKKIHSLSILIYK